MPQSRKILRIFFKIWIFNVPRDSVWRLVRGWKVQSQRDSEIFVAYLATLLQVELLVAKNTQINFSKFLSWVFWRLARDLTLENRVFCANRSVFKRVQFSLNISDCSLSSPFQTSFKLTVSLSKNLHFYIISTWFFKKRYGFSYNLIAFHVYCMCFLDFCVVVWVLWHLLFMYGMGLFYWVG